MISNGQIANIIRGKPIGSHFRIGSFPPGAALGPYPGLLASYFACPHAVSGGKWSPGPWSPPPGASCHTPERLCGSRATLSCAVANWEKNKAAATAITRHGKFCISDPPPDLFLTGIMHRSTFPGTIFRSEIAMKLLTASAVVIVVAALTTWPVRSQSSSQGVWSQKARMLEPRGEVAAATAGGKIYVLGGSALGQDAQTHN